MTSNVPEEFANLEQLSPREIELELLKLREIDPQALSISQLRYAVALHTIARRTTSGPPKTKTTNSEPPKDLETLSSLL